MNDSETESYDDAVESGTVTELPAPAVASAVAPPPRRPCRTHGQILDAFDLRSRTGRWEDDNPPGTVAAPAADPPTRLAPGPDLPAAPYPARGAARAPRTGREPAAGAEAAGHRRG